MTVWISVRATAIGIAIAEAVALPHSVVADDKISRLMTGGTARVMSSLRVEI